MTRITLLVLFLLPAILAEAQAASVRAWEDELTIPTYPIGPEDSYPVFSAFGGRDIYPYAMQTDLSHEPVDVEHRVLMLENEHLRLIVLPDLGGRLYSLYDKDAKREVFYRNHVIKPGLVGRRGAWISGGIEFNFPTGHTVTGFSPVLGTVQQNDDGSASIIVGDVEKVSRMAWSVTLTLHPGSAALQQDVHLYNRTDTPHRYYFWSNAAFPAREQTRFVSPARYQTDHSGYEVYAWPVHEDVDLSWDRNNPDSQSYFALDVPEDYFGAYDHGADAGLVHVADYRQVPGKKFWTWGNGGSSDRWVDILTDDDGQYIEVQSGRFWNQSTWKLLPPQQSVRWREWWYGVTGLDGFDAATEHAAIRLTDDDGGLRVAVRSVRTHKKGRIVAERGGRVLATSKIDLRADRPATVRLDVADTAGVIVRLLAGDRPLLVWDPSSRIEQPDVPVGDRERRRYLDPEEMTADEALQAARRNLEQDDAGGAAEVIRYGLLKDPAHVGLLTMRGHLELDAGLAAEAAASFDTALARDPDDPAALHGRAASALALGDAATAEAVLRAIVDDPVYGTAARGLIGEALLRSGRARAAAGVFAEASARDPWAAKVSGGHAAALRALGDHETALAVAEAGLARHPLSNLLHAERWLALGALNRARPDRPVRGPDDADVLLEVVVDERALGDDEAAAQLLRAALFGSPTAAPDVSALPGDVHAISVYWLAATEARLGNAEAAASLWRTASELPTRNVFPYRPETLDVLDAALRHNPQDAAALFYRGSILARHRRVEAATQDWSAAVAVDPTNPVAWRNLALARIEADEVDLAVVAYRRAIDAAPTDVRLYSDLEDLYEDSDADLDTRLANITAGLAAGDDDELATSAAELLNEAGRHDEAIDLLSNRQFDVWEGGYSIHRAWQEAHIGAGQLALEDGDATRALHHFERAMEYPANLGVGRPSQERLAWPRYWSARANLALGRSDEAQALFQLAATEDYGRASPAQYYQVLAFRALGDDAAAKQVADDMLAAARRSRRGMDSGYGALLAGLGYDGLGNREKARELLQKFVDDPGSSRGRFGRYARQFMPTAHEILAQR